MNSAVLYLCMLAGIVVVGGGGIALLDDARTLRCPWLAGVRPQAGYFSAPAVRSWVASSGFA